MKTSVEKDEEVCLKCKRTLVGESKFGLCPVCFNKYGSPVAGLFGGILSLGSAWVLKNRGKIVKGAIDVIKHIKS